MNTKTNFIKCADALSELKKLPDNFVNTVVTSPPYNKKGIQNGKTQTSNQIWGKHNIDYNNYHDNMPENEYQNWMIEIINELHRVITDDGSIFFNHKPRRNNNQARLPTEFLHKTNANIYQLIIWNRKNSPNIRKDHLLPNTEHIYWLCKNKPKTFRENLDSRFITEIWDINPQKQTNHPAPFPPQLAQNCIILTTQEGDIVLDPFNGCGTTSSSANELNRKYIGYDIDEEYVIQAQNKLESRIGLTSIHP
jgi:site-specific DNA-methyltransferase (adenine-specific)